MQGEDQKGTLYILCNLATLPSRKCGKKNSILRNRVSSKIKLAPSKIGIKGEKTSGMY